MKRFDLTTLEGNEARLNHGDSERVRLKEEEIAELRQAKKSLDWLLKRGIEDKQYMIKWIVGQLDCPPYLKSRLEEK